MFKRKHSKASSGHPWSDDELRIAIDSYLYMLRLELSGISFSVEGISKSLIDGLLSKRNDASIRYRMRNISDIFLKKGLPILSGYSPAHGVGTRVRERIDRILDERSDALLLVTKMLDKETKKTTTLETVLQKLDKLEEYLAGFENEGKASIGHNHPPEPIEIEFIDFNAAKESLRNIKLELCSNKPNISKIEKDRNVILQLGLELAVWAGERFTDFSRAAAIAAGTGFGFWASKAGPQVADAMKSLAQYVQALG